MPVQEARTDRLGRAVGARGLYCVRAYPGLGGNPGLVGLGAQLFGGSSPTRGVALLRPPLSALWLSFPHPHIVVLGH